MTENHTFEQALSALESAVSQLESGDLSLDAALACFATGVAGATRCRSLLRDVETRVEVLLKESDGSLTTQPFDASGEPRD